MLLSYIFLHLFCQLCLVFVCLRAAPSKTIDEIISESTKDVTDADLMADMTGNVVRTELDMKLSLEQYQALYSSSQTSRLDVSSQLSRRKRKAIKPITYRWTNKEIPYKIEQDLFSQEDTEEINKAIQEWEEYTCITFRQAAIHDINFVSFENGTGCSSYVGMFTGTQSIILETDCRQKGVIVHEIGHAVGFFHEHNRPDRDDYVIIETENINDDDDVNFRKYNWSVVDTYNVPYDYSSIMHYGGEGELGNGKFTIKTRDPKFQNVIGQEEGLSFNDIKLANLMYSCNDKCNSNIVCPGDGFVGKDCQCLCRGNPVQKCLASENKVTTERLTIIPTRRATVRCRDLEEVCQIWKTQGYCTALMYKAFMSKICPLSCGKCKISSSLK